MGGLEAPRRPTASRPRSSGRRPRRPFIATYQATLASSLEADGVEVVLNVAPERPDRRARAAAAVQPGALTASPTSSSSTPIAPEPALDLVDAGARRRHPRDVDASCRSTARTPITVTYNAVLQAMVDGRDGVRRDRRQGLRARGHRHPGDPESSSRWDDGRDEALALCPDVRSSAQVQGLFQPPVAQQAVVQYLSTNPAGVDAVLQAGTMGWAIRDAFEPVRAAGPADRRYRRIAGLRRVGRCRTPTTPTSARRHRPSRWRQSAAQIGLKMLAGAGPKMNHIVWQPS